MNDVIDGISAVLESQAASEIWTVDNAASGVRHTAYIRHQDSPAQWRTLFRWPFASKSLAPFGERSLLPRPRVIVE